MTTRDEGRQFDVRTLDRNLRKGTVTRKDYERWVKNLPDVTDKSVVSKPDESRDDRDDRRYQPAPLPAAFGAAPNLDDELDVAGIAAELDDEDDDEDEDEDAEVAEVKK